MELFGSRFFTVFLMATMKRTAAAMTIIGTATYDSKSSLLSAEAENSPDRATSPFTIVILGSVKKLFLFLISAHQKQIILFY